MKLCIKKFENLPELACAINLWLVLLNKRQRAARTLSSLDLVAWPLLLLCTWMPSASIYTPSWG